MRFGSVFVNLFHHRNGGPNLGRFKKSFKNTYNKHAGLLVKAAVVSGASMALGDIICQSIALKGQEASPSMERVIRMGTIGVIISGPLNYAILAFVEYLFSTKRDVRTLLKKAAVQSAFTPLFCLLVLSASEFLRPGTDYQDIKSKLSRDYVTTVTTAWSFWPFVSLLNNRFVPFAYRANVSSVVGIFWNVIISYLANLSANREEMPSVSELNEQITFAIESDLQAQVVKAQLELQEKFITDEELTVQANDSDDVQL